MAEDNQIPRIVKEGWLFKRGEHIKNWRPRYFVLLEDGSLKGFRYRPDDKLSEPLNNFTVKGCQIMKTDKPKRYTFLIRGLQSNVIIERMFHVETEEYREEWYCAIKMISGVLSRKESLSTEIEIGTDVAAETDCFDEVDSTKSSDVESIPTTDKAKITLEKFEFLKVLGKGAFGKVILCHEKETSRLFAVKILKKRVIAEKGEVQHTLTEKNVMQNTSHPFLISLKYSFQTTDRLFFVMEYVNGGELYFHLQKSLSFPEERTRFYAAEIVSAIGYLHELGIIYRDIKLENLLLDKDGHIKIADFGLCKEDITYGRTTETFCGTPEYLAPEILTDSDYGRAVDWWGLGIVMFEMLTGHLPFFDKDHEVLFELIVVREARIPSSISTEATDLLSGLLEKDPIQRLGGSKNDSRDIMIHPFFASINWSDLVQKRITPPFKPLVSSSTDTSYFDSTFTGESVQLTPPEVTGLDSIIEEGEFKQFSYEARSCSGVNHSYLCCNASLQSH